MCLLYLYSIIDITGFVIGFMRRTHFCRKNAIFNTLTRSLKEQENGLHLSRADSYGGLYSAPICNPAFLRKHANKEDALHGIAKIWRNNEPFPKRTS